ncbi:hypothetical protein U1Q18_031854 [Sarracenia purpurea var. burkii]
MFMSIFSSFDALFAESFRQKVGFSSAAPGKEGKMEACVIDRREGTSSPVISENSSKTEGGNSSGRPVRVRKSEQRRPRFAPELDGVYCFETIVPY